MGGPGDAPSRVRSLVRRHGSAYVSAHAVPAAAKQPNLKEWSGLLATATVTRQDNTSDLLLGYWRTRDDFERHTKAFNAAVGPCEFEGFIRNSSEHWWSRLSHYVGYTTILVTLVAILGALQSLGSYRDWILLAPALDLRTKAPTLRYVAGDPITEAMDVVNHTTTAHNDLWVSAMLKDASGRTKVLDLTPSWKKPIPTLAANNSEPLQLDGTAPSTPGHYTLEVDLDSKAGWAVGRKQQAFTRSVEIWTSEPQIAQLQPGRARKQFDSMLEIGHPAPFGLRCQADLTRQPGVSKLVATSPALVDSEDVPPNLTPGQEYVGVKWRMAKSVGLQRVPFSLYVVGKVNHAFNSNSIQVNCDVLSEPVTPEHS